MRWLHFALAPAFALGGVAACGEDATPVFGADYAATFTEVRNCRSSSDHDLHRIKVLVDPAAHDPYTLRTTAFPVGAIVLKEEFDFGDTACAGPVIEWTVMQKLGSAEDLGWIWQRVAADRSVTTENDPLCITCHTSCGIAPDGYDGTCAMP
ncbi:MAG: cytochrome P460 family protein [Myxococcales bacterium]|nr:cytochrome P460 family protein [Myxococcales bacterium]